MSSNLKQGTWRTYNTNVKKQSMAIEEFSNLKVKQIVTRRLKHLQSKWQGHCSNCHWNAYTPKVKHIVAMRLKDFPKVKEVVKWQLKKLQLKGQGNCNKASDEITTQSFKTNAHVHLESLPPRGKGHCSMAFADLTTQKVNDIVATFEEL